MRILLSTIGSRGDVQPLVALALELKALGQEVRACVPPDFREWIEGLGVPVVPIGPELRSTGKARPVTAAITPEVRRQMMEGTVSAQFETIGAAAEDCDVIVGATALQIAAPTVAEKRGIPYVFASYCPAVIPSKHHAPPVLGLLGDKPAAPGADFEALWEKDMRRWNETWAPLLNPHRERLGFKPVENVLRYVLTDRPWLACDAIVGPWPEPDASGVFQAGAWILPDERPLDPELVAFLDAGDPPVYFGFGSNRAPGDFSRIVIRSARALGRRAIVSRGWAELELPDDSPDCLAVGETNFRKLFPRLAAVVHHGGAGTTTAAARAGVPQVIVPQVYDQHYFAGRVQELGIGVAHAPGAPTEESLTAALRVALQASTVACARAVSETIRDDGARTAARELIAAHR